MNSTASRNTYNDKRLDQVSTNVFDATMKRAERMMDGTDPMNVERLRALGALANAAGLGFHDDQDARDEAARDDMARRVFAKALTTASVKASESGWDPEVVEAYAAVADAAACGFKDNDESDEGEVHDL